VENDTHEDDQDHGHWSGRFGWSLKLGPQVLERTLSNS
jgi:hypothetical protein